MAKRRETRQKIIYAAGKVFFEHGYEEASVKMIIEEAGVVTGSFYHFFPSKEILFDEVIKEFTAGFAESVKAVFINDALSLKDVEKQYLDKMAQASEKYFGFWNGDRLHWSIQSAVKERSVAAIREVITVFIKTRIKNGRLKSKLDVDEKTLADILIRGSASIVEGKKQYTAKLKKQLYDFWNLLVEEI